MSENDPFFTSQNQSLGIAAAADDLLHPKHNALTAADSATETQYFGFSVPEAQLHAYCYLWYHPRLKVVTGGLLAWRGIKATPTAAEICDIRCYMSDNALKDDLHRYRLDNGYGVEIIEPLKRHHLTYSDAARKNSVDLEYEAIAPPVMFGDGHHFEQPMKVRGEVMLRGQRYSVDGYTVRDRSWGKPRPEDNLPVPPYSWIVGVFNDGFAFNCGIFDQASGNPEIKGKFELPENKALSGGWILRDGKTSRIKHARKRVERDRNLRIPKIVELEMTDELERTITVQGQLVSSCPWTPWTNVHMTISLMRWECAGLIGHGDCQDAMWTDYCQQIYG